MIVQRDPRIREIIRQISGVALSQGDITTFSYEDALISKGLEPARAEHIAREPCDAFTKATLTNWSQSEVPSRG